MKFVDQFDNLQESNPQTDLPNRRIVTLDNGRTFRLERTNPFGLVHIVWDRGHPPEALQGKYTTFGLAWKALELWVSNNTFDEITDKPVEKAEPIKYKAKYRDPKTGKNMDLEDIRAQQASA